MSGLRQFFAKLNSLTKDRGLQASYIVDSHGKILASTKQQFLKDPKPPSADRYRAGAAAARSWWMPRPTAAPSPR